MASNKVAAGIKARHDFWSKKLSEATTEQEVNTATAALTRIENEAKERGVDLAQMATDAANDAAPGGKDAGETAQVETQEAEPAAAAPVATKGKQPKSVTEKEKVAQRAAKIAEERGQGKTPGQTKPKGQPKPKAEAKLRPCLEGCGTMVTGNFKMGHDAKLKSLILKIERGEEEMGSIPEVAQGLVAFRKGEKVTEKDGKGQVKSVTQLYEVTKAPVKFNGRPEITLTKRDD